MSLALLVARAAAPLIMLLAAAGAQATEIGRVKVAKGAVTIERGGQSIVAAPGLTLQTADVVRTGPDAAVGITMSDNSLLSAGPNSLLALDHFSFDPTTHQGRFDSSLRRGTLAVVSGKLAKQSPEAMTVKTPAAILGIRGTEFVVSVDEPAQ